MLGGLPSTGRRDASSLNSRRKHSYANTIIGSLGRTPFFSFGASVAMGSTACGSVSLGVTVVGASACGAVAVAGACGDDSASFAGKVLTDGTSCSDEIDCAESSMG